MTKRPECLGVPPAAGVGISEEGVVSVEDWEFRTMSEVQFKVHVADDRKAALLEIGAGGEPPHKLALSLDQLTTLIGQLGEARRQMVQGQPIPDLEGKVISTVGSTNWHVQASPIKGSLIAFYHPSFGPVGFTMPRDDAVKLVRFLTNRLALSPAASEQRN